MTTHKTEREWISVEEGMAPLPPGTVALHESWMNGWRVDVFVWGERSTWTKGDRRYSVLFNKMPTPPPFPESKED